VLFINDTDAADYADVEVHVRLGTLEQRPIRGFELATTTIEVDVDLEGPDADSSSVFQPLFGGNNSDPTTAAAGGSSDSLWTTYGVATSITTPADFFSVVVEYPQGIYQLDPSGAVLPWPTAIAVRYVELDGVGAPITTGGPQGDGYVRLRPTPRISYDVQGSFSNEFVFPLYDPQTYVAPTRGRVLTVNTQGSAENIYASRAGGVLVPAGWSPGSEFADGFSIGFWASLRPNGSQTGDTASTVDDADLITPATVLEWISTSLPARGGFSIRFELLTFTIAPGHTRQRIVPVLRTVDAAGTSTDHYEKKGAVGDVTFRAHLYPAHENGAANYEPRDYWNHVEVTYKKQAFAAQDRIRIYANGELVHESYGLFNCTVPNSSTTLWLCRNSAGNAYFKGYLDDVVVWGYERDADEIRRTWNYGLGVSTPSDARQFANFSFDATSGGGDGLGNGEVIDDVSPRGNDVTTAGVVTTGIGTANRLSFGAPNGYQSFIDQDVPSNSIKSSKWRIEVMRAFADQTDTTRADDVRWTSLKAILDRAYSHPGFALVGVRIRASEELSGAVPTIKVLGKWRKVPVWDGASTTRPTFALEFSRSPAWITADVLLSEQGLASIFRASDVDVESLQEVADYAAEAVYDQRGDRREFPDFDDLLYSTVLGGAVPGIQVRFPSGTMPAHYAVGGYVGWYGLPTVATYVDHNAEQYGGGGYPILAVVPDDGVVGFDYVLVEWTRASEGHPWPNGTLLSASATLAGTVEGREPRFLFDGAFDTPRAAWDALLAILSTARAAPVRDGRRLRFRLERPRDPIDVIGEGNCDPKTFEGSFSRSFADFNALNVTFLDEALGFERSTYNREDPSIQDSDSLAAIVEKSFFLEGVTRRSQVARHVQFMLNLQRFATRSFEFVGSIDALPLEPGDAFLLATDLLPRGISGRISDDCSRRIDVRLDRTVELVGGHVYSVSCRSATAPAGTPHETREVDLGVSMPGTYPLGSILVVDPPFSFVPKKGDVYVLCDDGNQLVASVVGISLSRDFRRRIRAVELRDEVFEVEGRDFLPDVPANVASLGLSIGTDGLPDEPESVVALEAAVRGPGGSFRSRINVSWTTSGAGVAAAAHEVYASVDGGTFRRVASIRAPGRSAEVDVPETAAGRTYRFAVVGVSERGSRRRPDRARAALLRVVGSVAPPAAPASLLPYMQGDQAVYDVTPQDAQDGVVHEIRRGGWILGQHVVSLPHGTLRFGPTPDFTTVVASSVTVGRSAGAPLFVRARNGQGKWSDFALAYWGPRTLGGTSLTDLPEDYFTSTAWEDFGDGWKWDGATAPNATLTDLDRRADGTLGFDGSALEATYETAFPQVLTTAIAEDVYVSAFVEAQQIHPLPIDSWDWPIDDPGGQWSLEGPLDEVQDGDDPGRCALSIWVRFLDASQTWSDWRPYKPSRVVCVAVQFRIEVSRPDVTFDVAISRFSTQLIRAQQTKYDADDLQRALSSRRNRG
jgi:hypothetical protein